MSSSRASNNGCDGGIPLQSLDHTFLHFVAGHITREALKDPEIKRRLESVHPFATPGDTESTVFRKNLVVFTGTLVFFGHCVDRQTVYWKAVSTATGWREWLCQKIARMVLSCRRTFVHERGHQQLPGADTESTPVERLICALVDKYTEIYGLRGETYELTAARKAYIEATKKEWAEILKDDPERLLLHHSAAMFVPALPRVRDWRLMTQAKRPGGGHYPDRNSRSASPESDQVRDAPYRLRSPLRRPTEHPPVERRASGQLPTEQSFIKKPAYGYSSIEHDIASDAGRHGRHADSTIVPSSSLPLAIDSVLNDPAHQVQDPRRPAHRAPSSSTYATSDSPLQAPPSATERVVIDAGKDHKASKLSPGSMQQLLTDAQELLSKSSGLVQDCLNLPSDIATEKRRILTQWVVDQRIMIAEMKGFMKGL